MVHLELEAARILVQKGDVLTIARWLQCSMQRAGVR